LIEVHGDAGRPGIAVEVASATCAAARLAEAADELVPVN
jgi:hypothetical protein